jgi:filamentous hemagglutinin family protein
MMAQERSGFWKSCFTIAFALSMGVVPGYGDRASAQIIPDETLGNEPSLVTPIDEQVDRLDGGAIRGSNLFHSFREFNVGEGRGAYFANPAAIANIFSRVTGSNPSNILGTLGVLGEANLFVLNPNGILFGPNAKLDLKGSFLATTADSILFPEGNTFSATNPEAPPILTVNVQAPIGLQFEGKETVGRIENRSTAPAGEDLLENPVFGLRVPDSKSLLLVGGDIAIDGGGLNALGGRVELAAVAGEGIVGLNVDGSNLSLSVPDQVARANVSLINKGERFAIVNVRAANGGSIAVNARNLEVFGGGILAGILPGLDSIDSKAGDIEINVTKATTVNRSLISNAVIPGAVGNSGDVNITTNSLSVTNGGQLNASTFGSGDAGDVNITTNSLSVNNGGQLNADTLGEGDAGNVTINARDTVYFDGFNEQFPRASSGVFTSVESGAVGKGGNIDITARSLFMSNGAQLQADTEGEGDAGNVKIDAHETVSLDGVGGNGLSSAVFSSIGAGGVGKGGNIDIIADSLFITNGAGLSVSNLGQGDAGDVTIHARSIVSLDGVGSNGFPSAVFGSVAEDPDGSLEKPIGNGGDINITTDLLTITNGARLTTNTIVGQGDAGAITIRAREVSFDGVGSDGPSGAFSAVGSEAMGNGVGIKIMTESLFVKNGALLSSSTRGQGDGGNITINANTLEAFNGGQVVTTSFSSGKAGNITLNVTDSVTFAGIDPTFFDRLAQFGENVEDVVIGVSPSSGLFANTEEGSSGNGGNIFIDPTTMNIRDGAQVAVNSSGSGIGGNIELQAGSLTLDRGTITAETASNQGGNINLKTSDLLLLRNNSQISSTAGTDRAGGDGGNITIDAPFIVAVAKENSNIQANAFEGNGGNINITTNGIFGIESRDRETLLSDITASSQFGREGQVEINTSGIDPTRSLTNLPQETVEAEVAQGCQTEGGQPKVAYFDIGRGGLPPSPDDLFNSEMVIAEWIPLDFEEDKQKQQILENSFTENKLTLLTAFPCQKSTQTSIN